MVGSCGGPYWTCLLRMRSHICMLAARSSPGSSSLVALSAWHELRKVGLGVRVRYRPWHALWAAIERTDKAVDLCAPHGGKHGGGVLRRGSATRANPLRAASRGGRSAVSGW